MPTVALFFIELFFLFLLSKSLTTSLSQLFYRISQNKQVTIYLLAVLFFPGTLLHELAHLVIAKCLLVPVSHIEFIPKLEGESVKLGSVGIAKTDPLRRLVIGIAPFFAGTCILLTCIYIPLQANWFHSLFILLLIGYLVFEVGNTMFSSKNDLKGALELLLIFILFTVIFYLLGLRFPSVNLSILFNNSSIKQLFTLGDLFLLAPLAIDGVVILIIKLFV